MRIYLDTSVYGMSFDGLKPKKELKRLIDHVNDQKFVVLVSEMLLDELRQSDKRLLEKFKRIMRSIAYKKPVKNTDRVVNLANSYIALGALTQKSRNDATHIAVATLRGADYIISKNMKHFINNAHVFCRYHEKINVPFPKIVTPQTFLDYEKEKN